MCSTKQMARQGRTLVMVLETELAGMGLGEAGPPLEALAAALADAPAHDATADDCTTHHGMGDGMRS